LRLIKSGYIGNLLRTHHDRDAMHQLGTPNLCQIKF
jgi:hypothetical protein